MGIVDKAVINLAYLAKENGSYLIILFLIIVPVLLYLHLLKKQGNNPFNKACLRKRGPVELDSTKRDSVLKQGFTSKKVPSDLDAVVVGSGIGGLSCAALLAKAGQKVLVLEQHDQAGGCCHTFIEDGYEFDVGIHYVGEVEGNTLTQTYIDQITEGQLGWAPVEDCIDRVELGTGDDRSTHDVLKGKENWKNELKSSFPYDHAAIDKYFNAMKEVRKVFPHNFMIKILPLWLVKFLLKTGLFGLMSNLPKYTGKSLQDFMDEITDNKRLQAALCYSFGDYGTQPRETPMLMQLVLMQHYTYGGYYPIGGASEIAYHIIPVIEKNGGKVLVRANVTEILLDDNGTAVGVSVSKGSEDVKIYAKSVISAAGVINTYKRMLPKHVSQKLDLENTLFQKVESGNAALSVFVGLKGSNEELGLKATNTWAFSGVDLNKLMDDYIALPAEEVGKSDIPLLFISFPSTKDPLWNEKSPGKSNCTIVTLGNWDWFAKWEDERVKKRGEDYDDLKNRLAEKIWEQTCRFYPQLKDKRDYFDVGTPLTNNYYIGSPKGEIYGLDHSMSRFDPAISCQLRPATPIPGLYLTGQDIATCGFAGALYSGLLTAATLVNRNLMTDLVTLTKELRRDAKSKTE